MIEGWRGGGAVMEEAVRLREANRKQLILHPTDLEGLLEAEHPARAIWRVLEGLALGRFEESIKAREGSAGRDATDPRILLALWLYGLSQGGEQRARTGAAEHAACRVSLDLRRGDGQLPSAE